jgi:hypothetical protein
MNGSGRGMFGSHRLTFSSPSPPSFLPSPALFRRVPGGSALVHCPSPSFLPPFLSRPAFPPLTRLDAPPRHLSFARFKGAPSSPRQLFSPAILLTLAFSTSRSAPFIPHVLTPFRLSSSLLLLHHPSSLNTLALSLTSPHLLRVHLPLSLTSTTSFA